MHYAGLHHRMRPGGLNCLRKAQPIHTGDQHIGHARGCGARPTPLPKTSPPQWLPPKSVAEHMFDAVEIHPNRQMGERLEALVHRGQ